MTIEIVTGERIRTWGGWYRQDRVLLDGVEIGRIQTARKPKSRRLPGRINVITFRDDACVLGSDVDWLVRQHRAAEAAS